MSRAIFKLRAVPVALKQGHPFLAAGVRHG